MDTPYNAMLVEVTTSNNPSWEVQGKCSFFIWIYAASPYIIYFLHSHCLLISSTCCYQFILVTIQSWLYDFPAVPSQCKIHTSWCDLHVPLRSGTFRSFKFQILLFLVPSYLLPWPYPTSSQIELLPLHIFVHVAHSSPFVYHWKHSSFKAQLKYPCLQSRWSVLCKWSCASLYQSVYLAFF